MPLKLMRFSSNIIAGLGSIEKLGQSLVEFGVPKNITVLCGKNAFEVTGKHIYNSLSAEKFQLDLITDEIEPDVGKTDLLVEKLKKKQPEITAVLAIGGGGTIDVAKYLAKSLNQTLVVVPTLLSSDAMATGYSILWDGSRNRAIQTMVPSIIIGDYEILKNQPKRFVAAGTGDMLSKYSALFDWRLGFWLGGDTYNDFAMNVAQSVTELLKKRIADVARMNYIGIETLFLAEVTDGYLMEVSGTTRVAAGSEHLFTFAAETLTESGLHGELCGLGTIMMTYLQKKSGKNEVIKLLEAVGAPTNAAALDMKPETVVKALMIAHKMRSWYTILGSNGLSEGSAERLAKYTGVI